MSELIPSIITGASSIALAWTTIWLNNKISKSKEKAQTKADIKQLATYIGPKLREYAISCLEVSRDDGTNDFGFPSNGHENLATTHSALFSISDFTNFNWQALPHDTLQDFLYLEEKHKFHTRAIEKLADIDPPDHLRYFIERQHTHAQLGLFALELSDRLMKLGGFKVSDDEEAKKFESEFTTRINEIRDFAKIKKDADSAQSDKINKEYMEYSHRHHTI